MWRLVLVLAGCATSHGSQVLHMSTGCLSGCVAYEVVVYEDGFLEYRDAQNIAYRHTAHVDLAALDRAMRPFATIDAHAIQCEETDLGTLYSIIIRGRHVSFFDLCPKASEAVAILGGILSVLPLERWITAGRGAR